MLKSRCLAIQLVINEKITSSVIGLQSRRRHNPKLASNFTTPSHLINPYNLNWSYRSVFGDGAVISRAIANSRYWLVHGSRPREGGNHVAHYPLYRLFTCSPVLNSPTKQRHCKIRRLRWKKHSDVSAAVTCISGDNDTLGKGSHLSLKIYAAIVFICSIFCLWDSFTNLLLEGKWSMRGMKFKTKCRRDFYREDSFLVTVSLARDGPSCPALKKKKTVFLGL